MVGAGLSGLLGWIFGFPAVFALAALFGVLSIASVLMIPKKAIDDRVARGLGDDDEEKVGALRVLLECKPLLMLAAALACFISATPPCFRSMAWPSSPSSTPTARASSR